MISDRRISSRCPWTADPCVSTILADVGNWCSYYVWFNYDVQCSSGELPAHTKAQLLLVATGNVRQSGTVIRIELAATERR